MSVDGMDLEITRARDLVMKLRGEIRCALLDANDVGAAQLRHALSTSDQMLSQLDTLALIAERRRLH